MKHFPPHEMANDYYNSFTQNSHLVHILVQNVSRKSQINHLQGGLKTKMVVKIKKLVIFMISAGLILLAACASAPAAPVMQADQPAKQSTAAQPQAPANQSPDQQDPTVGYGTSSNDNATGAKTPMSPVNRVDVIYFHVNQRCVTCLCFEQHVTKVIDTYFQDAINSGKLTYQVLNVQKPENEAISKKYQAVGSQLFVNVIIKGVNNIQDIQSIWNWKCANDPHGFELKVKNVIQGGLNQIP